MIYFDKAINQELLQVGALGVAAMVSLVASESNFKSGDKGVIFSRLGAERPVC